MIRPTNPFLACHHKNCAKEVLARLNNDVFF